MVPFKQAFGQSGQRESDMIGVVATLKVQPEKASEFEKVFLDLAAKVKANEPGCLMYQLTKSRTEAGVYKVLEVYASDEALKAHGGTDYFKAAGAAMGPTMAGRPEIEYLDGVE
jgi:quinol monooxygenase YgiN